MKLLLLLTAIATMFFASCKTTSVNAHNCTKGIAGFGENSNSWKK